MLTLNDDEKLVAYAKEIYREVRAEADFSSDPIKATRNSESVWRESMEGDLATVQAFISA